MSDDDELDAGHAADADGPAVPPGQDELVTLRHLPLMEAELAKARLQGADIDCYLGDQAMAQAYSVLQSTVRLMVMKSDLARAAAILDAPVAGDDFGEYVDEDWRCPKCHQKKVELVRLEGMWKVLRRLCAMFWVALVVTGMTDMLLPDSDRKAISDFIGPWYAMLIAGAVVSSVAILGASRSKRCTNCGHVWKAG